MAYTAWSVVYGEQPTAAKWNQLGTNDAGFKDGTLIDADAINVNHLLNPYKMRAYRNAAVNSPSAAFAKVTLDTENYDTNNNFATGTYTVPVTGYYKVTGRIAVAGASLTRAFASIYKNGSAISRGSDEDSAGAEKGSVVEDVLFLSAGDTIELYIYTNVAVAINVGTTYQTYMAIHLIST